jgi:hypothetical protein
LAHQNLKNDDVYHFLVFLLKMVRFDSLLNTLIFAGLSISQ